MCNPELDGYALPKSDRGVRDDYHYPPIPGTAEYRAQADGVEIPPQYPRPRHESIRPMAPPVEWIGGETQCLTLAEFLMFGAGIAVGTFLTYFVIR